MAKIQTTLAKLDIHHAQAALAAEGISASDDEVLNVLAHLRGLPEAALVDYETGSSKRLVVTQAEGSRLRAGRSPDEIMSCLFRYASDLSASSR